MINVRSIDDDDECSALGYITGENSANDRGYQRGLGRGVDIRQEFEKQTVASHRVQDARQWKYCTQKTL